MKLNVKKASTGGGGGGDGIVVGAKHPVGSYINGLLGGSTAANSAGHIADKVVAFLVYFPQDTPIDRFACFIGTANTGATLRFALCSDNGAGIPGDVLYTHTGVIDASTTGAKELTVAHTIPAGMYWAVAQTGGASCVTRTAASDSYFNLARRSSTEVQAPISLSAARVDSEFSGSLAGLVWTGSSNVPHGIWVRAA